MCNEMIIRRFAGGFVLASVLLAWLIHPAWLLLTAFVGVNLLQSSWTSICPLNYVLGFFGLFGCGSPRRAS